MNLKQKNDISKIRKEANEAISKVLSETPNEGNRIEDYDMIAAITQSTINMQFDLLWEGAASHHRKMSWEFEDEELGLTFKFNGDMDAPEVFLGTPLSPHFSLQLSIKVPKGNLSYTTLKGKHYYDIENWIYVFDVNVDLKKIEKETLKNNKSVPDVVTNMLDNFDESQFNINHLFMNFQNSNIANYDENKSKFPGLDKMSPTVLALFQTGLSNYFKNLNDPDNPYILGYLINDKTHNSNQEVTFNPTKGTYWIFNEDSNEKMNALNFLTTVNGKPLPSKTEPNFKVNWIKSNEHDGRFVVAKGIFFDKFILEQNLFKCLNKYYIGKGVKSGGSAYSYFDIIEGINWKAIEVPSLGNNHWKYSFEHTSQWISNDVKEALTGYLFETKNTLQNKFDFSMDIVNITTDTAKINLSGKFFLNYTLEFQPIQGVIFESVWTTSEENWTGYVLLEAGTNGSIKITPQISHDKSPKKENGGNFWGQIDTSFGGFENFKKVAESLSSLFNHELLKLESDFGNAHSSFILPAGSTFAFKNPQFDSYQNLLLDITYKTEK